MAVVIRDTPPTFDWGWFSREDPRMHLQSVDKDHRHLHYKVWLEKKGKRVFDPEPEIPARVVKALKRQIEQQRGRIEAYWIIFMIQNNWLRVRLVGDQVVVQAYPNTPNRFERTIPLAEVIPNHALARAVTQQDLRLNPEYGVLEFFPRREEGARLHVRLEPVLWTG
jgi:mRNA-degrading endonuclease RelE of RelBE toxin-antitoxin system